MRTKNNFGVIGEVNVTHNYGHSRRVNCTINPPELQRSIAQQREDEVKRIATIESYKQVKKGKRTKQVKGEKVEVLLKSGSTQIKERISTTTRLEH